MPQRSQRNLQVAVFSSFAAENRAEHRRLAGMKPAQRWAEFAVLQQRVLGTQWTGASRHSENAKPASEEAHMIFTPDMKDLLGLFERHQVQYALVGGFAVNYYGYVRTTHDIDILIFPSAENARRTMQALADFGFGKTGLTAQLFETEGSAIHLGVEPNRINLLTHLIGVTNDAIFANMSRIHYRDIALNIIALPDLLQSKKASTRPKDLADADELEKINQIL